MKEGWNSDSYLILFDQDEVNTITESYGIPTYLPGYKVVAIQGWDDFIVENTNGERFIVPTIPLTEKHLTPFHGSNGWTSLKSDLQRAGKIKWYITPIVFGGDPNQGPNLTWIDFSTHQQAVRYWNDLYRDISKST